MIGLPVVRVHIYRSFRQLSFPGHLSVKRLETRGISLVVQFRNCKAKTSGVLNTATDLIYLCFYVDTVLVPM